MITLFEQFQNKRNELVLYHGSEVPQNFSSDRILFLSSSKFFSSGYGNYLYEVTIKPKNMFYSTSDKDMEKLIDEMIPDKYYDPYEDKYYEDFEDYKENNPFKYSDTWEGIEYIIKKYGIEIFSDEKYDCLLITEGGETNYIIFNKSVIINIKEIFKFIQ